MSTPDERRQELIAAAVAEQLSDPEKAELDALRRVDPTIDHEIEQLRAAAHTVSGALGDWDDVTAGDAFKARVLAGISDAAPHRAPDAAATPIAAVPAATRHVGRRAWTLPLTAAACLVVGIGAGLVIPSALSAPPSGPPGTLGAVEHVQVRDELPAATIDADIVAHTWGTEAVLDATGLDVGETYSVVLVGTDGSEFSAGEMLGSQVAIHCRLNAAVLREDVARLEIREGTVAVAVADLPEV